MADDPFAGDVLKLDGKRNRWRRRVGNFRIFFAVDSDSKKVDVSAIVRRTSTTY
jgi:mRNA-degrading endonuclease RelE of RelBE toxin-antitoxin system